MPCIVKRVFGGVVFLEGVLHGSTGNYRIGQQLHHHEDNKITLWTGNPGMKTLSITYRLDRWVNFFLSVFSMSEKENTKFIIELSPG